MPFRSEPSTPTAVLGDDLIRVVKLLHHARQQSPRAHPQVDPMAYPLLFNLKVAPMRVSALAEVLHSDVSTVSRQVSTLVDLAPPGPTQPAWDHLMVKRRRKTLVVCTACHDVIHAHPVTNAA